MRSHQINEKDKSYADSYSYSRPIVLRKDLTEERLIIHQSAGKSYQEGEHEFGYLSVDCEMMGLKPSRDRLCLVQMCDEHRNITLVQIEPGQDEAPNLKKLLEDPNIIKIFHFARADLIFLRYQLGILVNPVFCTKVASKLARTYTERHGLREVSRELLGVDLNKNQQSSDWGKSNLSQEQIDYAIGDVLYLNELREKLSAILKREERLGLAQKCFDALELLVELDILNYDFLFEHSNPLKNQR